MQNNFSFLRLVCALLVIITHSYELLGEGKDILFYYSNQHISLSLLAVNSFFVISGFLIFKSFERSLNLKEFIKKRFLRIYPAFFVSVIICLFVAFWQYSIIPQSLFWQQSDTWTFLIRNISVLFIQHEIQGVFSHNPIQAINGSWWTIPYEVFCYALLAVFFLMKTLRNNANIVLIIMFAILFVFNLYMKYDSTMIQHWGVITTITSLLQYFIGGALMQFVLRKLNVSFVVMLLLAMVSFMIIPYYNLQPILYFTLPIVIIGFGNASYRGINKIDALIGDVSYGMYLFAYPVQQILIAMHIVEKPIILIILSTIITFIIAKISWNFIEKPALNLKYNQRNINLRTK